MLSTKYVVKLLGFLPKESDCNVNFHLSLWGRLGGFSWWRGICISFSVTVHFFSLLSLGLLFSLLQTLHVLGISTFYLFFCLTTSRSILQSSFCLLHFFSSFSINDTFIFLARGPTPGVSTCQVRLFTPVTPDKASSGEWGLLCSTGALQEEAEYTFQPIFGVETWALGFNRGRTGARGKM
jgi:hypothetical protein